MPKNTLLPRLSFQSTFNIQLFVILVELFDLKEIFLKIQLIDKNFYSLFKRIRSHGKLWKNKFAYEFVSDYDR